MIFGHDAQAAALRDAITSGRLHHGWLLAGPRGIGKRAFAEASLRWLLPAAHDTPLLDADTHPDVVRLVRLENDKGGLARSITVDQVRAMRQRLMTATAMGGRRVVIIDAADELEGAGGPNALLKSLEEPPASTIFLLISHAPGRLLPTIRSRCRTLSFAPLADEMMRAYLAHALPERDPEIIVRAAGGSPGEAQRIAALDLDAIDAALAMLAETGDVGNAVRSQLVQQLGTKAEQARYEAFLRRVPAFIALHARSASVDALGSAVEAWERATEIVNTALPRSLPADMVVFELAGLVASLAGKGTPAKA